MPCPFTSEHFRCGPYISAALATVVDQECNEPIRIEDFSGFC
jgi:hypothetical protein